MRRRIINNKINLLLCFQGIFFNLYGQQDYENPKKQEQHQHQIFHKLPNVNHSLHLMRYEE
jgi:hypothetical protein